MLDQDMRTIFRPLGLYPIVDERVDSGFVSEIHFISPHKWIIVRPYIIFFISPYLAMSERQARRDQSVGKIGFFPILIPNVEKTMRIEFYSTDR